MSDYLLQIIRHIVWWSGRTFREHCRNCLNFIMQCIPLFQDHPEVIWDPLPDASSGTGLSRCTENCWEPTLRQSGYATSGQLLLLLQKIAQAAAGPETSHCSHKSAQSNAYEGGWNSLDGTYAEGLKHILHHISSSDCSSSGPFPHQCEVWRPGQDCHRLQRCSLHVDAPGTVTSTL